MLIAADHDFNCDSITPSVKLLVTPPTTDDAKTPASYYDGKVYVSLKDATLQASNPLRHAAETLAAIKHAGHEGVKVLVIKTDGGPDRNNKRIAVQLAFLALALEMDLDCCVLVRTTPGQSYVNPVERVMSVLNLGLYGVALERGNCGVATETLLTTNQSMKTRRVVMSSGSSDEPSVHERRFVKSMQVR